jgi:hypothetical protein
LPIATAPSAHRAEDVTDLCSERGHASALVVILEKTEALKANTR